MLQTPPRTLTFKPAYRSAAHAGIAIGFRSGLEEHVSRDLTAKGVPFEYETRKVRYVRPAYGASYTPDFILPNGIVIETKGRFEADDREKHLLVKAQHPGIDIRLVFSRSGSPIRANSPTTYCMWCRTHGFLYADKLIPQEWLDEPADPARIAALADASESLDLAQWATFKLTKKRG